MKVSVILPSIDLVTDPENDIDVNGANIALWIQLKTYANHPAFTELELFLAPADFSNTEGVAKFAGRLLKPENRGKGRVSVHSIYAVGDVWADGVPRVLHTDDLWAISRDRGLRDRFAKGPMAHISDTHCIGHYPLHRSMCEVASLPAVAGDTIIACSNATATAITRTYGEDFPYRVTSRHRRIDAHDLEPVTATRKRELRESLGLPSDLKLAVFVGRVTPAVKGELALLIDALDDARDLPVGLVIAGVSNMIGYPEMLKEYAKSKGLADRLFMFGRFAPSKRPQWYQIADLFVFPGDTINEAFGQTTIEAMACGVPILQSAWSGMKETVALEYGTLVDTYAAPVPERIAAQSVGLNMAPQFLALAQSTVIDREQWFSAHRRWMTDDVARETAGMAARETFERSYNVVHQEEDWAEVLAACLAEAKSGRHGKAGSRLVSPDVDYDTALRTYVSVPWTDGFIFSETAQGAAWRKGKAYPFIYDELRALLDISLLRAIQEQIAVYALPAHEVASRLKNPLVSPKDVYFHLMFLAKHGFVRLSVK